MKKSTDRVALLYFTKVPGGTVSNIHFHEKQSQPQYYTTAVYVSDGAHVSFFNCSFTFDSLSSVRVDKCSTAKFERCEFMNAKLVALSIIDSKCLLDNCSLHSNHLSAIRIANPSEDRETGFAVITSCRIFGNLAGGIEVAEKAFAVIRKNKISDNKEFGVEVRLADAWIDKNQINDNKTFGFHKSKFLLFYNFIFRKKFCCLGRERD